MITPQSMSAAYERNVAILKLQAEGLSHAESLLQLPFRANCLNWVAGHLVTNRLNVLKLLGDDVTGELAELEHYTRESDPVTGDAPGVLPLEQLIARLEAAQERMAAVLAAITPEALAQEVAFFGRRSQSVGEWLFFFYFHDSYHTGQAEILRQAAGKDDKII